jgi:hypothetical protein
VAVAADNTSKTPSLRVLVAVAAAVVAVVAVVAAIRQRVLGTLA